MKKVWVDAHHDVWDLAVRPRPWTDALPALRWSFGMDEPCPRPRAAAGADATVVVRTATVPEETAADAARPGRAAMTAVGTAAPGAGTDRGVADRPHAERILRGRGRVMVGCIQGNASPLRGLQW